MWQTTTWWSLGLLCPASVPREKKLTSRGLVKFMQILENTVIKMNGKFEYIGLWGDNTITLAKSYDIAFHRLKCLLKTKFKRDPHLQQTIWMRKWINYCLRSTHGFWNVLINFQSWYLLSLVAFNPNKPVHRRAETLTCSWWTLVTVFDQRRGV